MVGQNKMSRRTLLRKVLARLTNLVVSKYYRIRQATLMSCERPRCCPHYPHILLDMHTRKWWNEKWRIMFSFPTSWGEAWYGRTWKYTYNTCVGKEAEGCSWKVRGRLLCGGCRTSKHLWGSHQFSFLPPLLYGTFFEIEYSTDHSNYL